MIGYLLKFVKAHLCAQVDLAFIDGREFGQIDRCAIGALVESAVCAPRGFCAVSAQARQGAALLGRRIAQREQELASTYGRLEEAAREQAPVARLDVQATRQLQFLLFEAISNVLQHAGASVLRIEAAMHGALLRLRVVDNGRGFEAVGPPRALRERAESIGARLTVQSRPQCTVVQLEFD